ncbi:MAG: hypothetical protein Q4F84_09915 [Fibrobacter sp.]|nr:hypothetical protein [Fibrobacter sp.]
MKIKLLIIMVILALASSSSGFDAKQGDFWACGKVSFSTTSSVRKDLNCITSKVSRLYADPTLRFFVLNNFFVGAKALYQGVFYKDTDRELDYSHTVYCCGELGTAFCTKVVCPYLAVGAGGLFDYFEIPVYAGAMFRISEHVGAQFELGYTFSFYEYTRDNRLSVGIGLCAFGKKIAVSVLNDFVERKTE